MNGKPKKSNTPKFFVAIFIAVFVFYTFQSVNTTNAAVPRILSFQGRLTNDSGSLLGGSGTNYYFKFAIYGGASGGSPLWSSGGTAITIKVTQGVFNTLLGDTTSGYDALDLNFDSSGYYLEVQVSSVPGSGFETLTPRQRIVSSGFAVNADTVHGGRFINATGVGQFGGLATVSYSRFGIAIADHSLTSASDVLISGIMEVDGQAFFDASASVSGSFEVGGTASISDTLTLAGGLTSNYTGSNSFSGSLDIMKGLHVNGASTIANTLGITKAISSAQLNIQQNSSLTAGFYVDSSGDLTLSTTGGNIKANDQNLWVCIGGCDLEDTPPAGDGNIIMENSFIFDTNGYKFSQSTASTSMYDSLNNEILQFDEGQ